MDTQNFSIIYEQEALQALADIGLYYETVGGANLKYENIKRIQAHISTLDFMPYKNPVTDFSEKVRKLVIQNMPYVVFYTVKGNNIYILEVIHTKRDQNYLKEKYGNF